MTGLEANKHLARKYIQMLNAADGDGFADMFVEDGAIIVQSPTMGLHVTRGGEAIRKLVKHLRKIFPETGLRITVDEMTAEENRVAVTAHSDAVHVSGKAYSNRYHFLFYFKDGKVTECHEYLDSMLVNNVFFDGAQRPQS